MQGKESSEQATAAKSSVGIDVCKSWLDIHVLPSAETLRVPNTREGIRKLKRWLGRFEVALMVVEATGKWHRPVRRSLYAEGFAVALDKIFEIAKTVDAKTMTLQYFEALKAIGASPSTKYIFPMEFTNLLRPLIGMTEDSARK